MGFTVDAQLPPRLARHLSGAGHDAKHTLDLPDQNRATDLEICRIADAEDRIVVSTGSAPIPVRLLGRTVYPYCCGRDILVS